MILFDLSKFAELRVPQGRIQHLRRTMEISLQEARHIAFTEVLAVELADLRNGEGVYGGMSAEERLNELLNILIASVHPY